MITRHRRSVPKRRSSLPRTPVDFDEWEQSGASDGVRSDCTRYTVERHAPQSPHGRLALRIVTIEIELHAAPTAMIGRERIDWTENIRVEESIGLNVVSLHGPGLRTGVTIELGGVVLDRTSVAKGFERLRTPGARESRVSRFVCKGFVLDTRI